MARQPGERATLSLRITADLFGKLDEEARRKGRPLSNEAELRLEASFAYQDLLQQVLELKYGAGVAGLLMVMGTAMNIAGQSAELSYLRERRERWIDNPFCYKEATKAAAAVLEALRPEGKVIAPREVKAAHWKAAAERLLEELPSDVPIYPDHNPYDAETAQLRRALGADIANRAARNIDPRKEQRARRQARRRAADRMAQTQQEDA